MPATRSPRTTISPIRIKAPVEEPSALALEVRSPRFAMVSHRGRVRRGNEDACGAQAELGAFVVCDGMGGAAAGEIASRLAVDTFLGTLKAGGRAKVQTTRARLERAVEAANEVVYQQSRQTKSQRGMGTTLVALMLEPEHPAKRLWLAHVGDSRCYLLHQGELRQLTEDHSLVEEHIRAGIMSRIQAETSPIRNIITRAVGSQPTVEVEIEAHEIHSGDVFLLASDGLTRELEDAEIAEILEQELALRNGSEVSEDAVNAGCQRLVDAANERGGGDNITVLLVCFR